jgi:ABC-type lipoprotein export system ATPase subunit
LICSNTVSSLNEIERGSRHIAMSQTAPAKKITLPHIKRIALENFDLYSNQPNAEVTIERAVFCLIGANGLGKSTFLNTINFVITGAVPEPSRNFQSAPTYYKNAARVDRTEDYFGGRISEASRSIARSTVELIWPTGTVRVTRDMFEGSGISRLILTDSAGAAPEELSVEDGSEPDDLAERYEAEVLKHSRLQDFAQFVFLFHFVSTFDEGRHLLMWDDGALTNALYLAFGADPAAATAADKLQRDMDRQSSRGRNIRFSARHVTERINQLVALQSGNQADDHVSIEQLKGQHEALLEQHTVALGRETAKQNELRDADSKWTELSSSLTAIQLEYRRLFSERLKKSGSVEHHPIIRATLSEDRCAICGTDHVKESLLSKLSARQCPLCDSPIELTSQADGTVDELRRLDGEIIKLRDDLATVLKTRERVAAELAAAGAAEGAARSALQEFETRQSTALARADVGSDFSAITKEIEKLQKEREQFMEQSAEHYKKRDEIRASLLTYEKQLKTQYEEGALAFVPRFRELAEEFIGLPVDVELEHRQGANVSGFGLRLKMADQVRSRPDKLSESQRFFVDIALRMALSEFMSDSPATLLIDTPEGSLDVAYEARAGAMFSKFAGAGNFILMTANLRSSQLVLRLAGLQHKTGMQVTRMTEWTDLSEVQQSEEKLFLEAYAAIDAALN